MKRKLFTLSIVSLFIKSFSVLLSCDSFLMSFSPFNCLVKSEVIPKGETLQLSNINESSVLFLCFENCRFSVMPSNLFVDNPQIIIFRVANNDLSSLKMNDLKNGNQLEVISFYFNNISALRNSTFRLCSNLKELEMYDNPLTTIETAAFSGLRKLDGLSIIDSRIWKISAVFDELVTLTEINLQNNSLIEIDPNLLRKNVNLDIINFQGNGFPSIVDNFLILKNPPTSLNVNFMNNQLKTLSTMQGKMLK